MDLFEVDKRRDDWIEGRAIRLENGETWEVPIPRIVVTLSLDGAEPKQAPAQRDDNRHFSRAFFDRQSKLLEAIIGMNADDKVFSDLEYVQAVLPLAVDLLRRNYDLANDEIGELLPLIPGDAPNASMWRELADVILGIGPKPVPAT